MSQDIVATARHLADHVLFPAAAETDAAGLVPAALLDRLADAGLYGIAGPPEAGGLGASIETMCAVVEELASGCLTTAFVWIQHHSAVRALASTQNAALREEWLADLCRGARRAGIALGGLRPGRGQLRATPSSGGWSLTGDVPWVSGWGRVDAVLAAAHAPGGMALRALVDAREGDGLTARPLRLVAANASGTVQLSFRRHFVPEGRVVAIEPFQPPPAYDGGGRVNGSLALGIALRCCRLIGPSALDAELSERRHALDAADDRSMAAARAAAAAFAHRAAGALVAHTGSRAILLGEHAQRLAREAQFVLVFGSRPAIREALLRDLGAASLGR